MAAVSIKDFAEECARQALAFGVNPHFLLAVAKLRSNIADDRDGEVIGPFRLTQSQWNSNIVDTKFELRILPVDIGRWRMQCAVFARIVLIAQQKYQGESAGRLPSAIELYLMIWPSDDRARVADSLSAALRETALFVENALERQFDETTPEIRSLIKSVAILNVTQQVVVVVRPSASTRPLSDAGPAAKSRPDAVAKSAPRPRAKTKSAARPSRSGIEPDISSSAVSAPAEATAPRTPPAPPPTPAPETSRRLAGLVAGFDQEASVIMRVAWVVSGRTRSGAPVELNAPMLMNAIVLAAEMLQPPENALAQALRRYSQFDNKQSNYAQRLEADFLLDESWSALLQTTDEPPQNGAIAAILSAARAIALRTSKSESEQISLRHLTAALLVDENGNEKPAMARYLESFGLTAEGFKAELSASIGAGWRDDDADAWTAILFGKGDFALVRADEVPDKNARESDSLGLRRFAEAIGGMIAARNQRPPISIAVFGPWGSGKSFFMAMIREAILDFAGRGSASTAPGDFVKGVIPIKFNAWHYVEGNLWASLVYSILDGLQAFLADTKQESLLEAALNKLELRKAADEDAKARLRDAEQRNAEAKAAEKKAADEAKSRHDEEKEIAATDVLSAFRAEAFALITPAGKPKNSKEWKAWSETIAPKLAEAARHFGRSELADRIVELSQKAGESAEALAKLDLTIGEVNELLEQARASGNRGAALVAWLANERIGRDAWLALLVPPALLVLVVLIVAGIIAAFDRQIAALFAAVGAIAAPLSGLAASAAGWLRRHLSNANQVLGALESVRDRIQSARDLRVAAHDTELVAARKRAEQAEAELAHRRSEAAAAAEAVQLARKEVEESKPTEQLKRFVAQRLKDGEYLRHLGLIHTIRTDLEQLDRYLKDTQSALAERAARALGEEGAATPEARKVERIVLFIDDLDRCSPDRVVEVLEAVHLLLAFPLFVVVVGVDIRWVSQALHKRYPGQLGAQSDGSVASPLDYLEKVFQIPFWLPPMDKEGGKALLRAAIGDQPAEDKRGDGTADKNQNAAQGQGGTKERGGQEQGNNAADGKQDEGKQDEGKQDAESKGSSTTAPDGGTDQAENKTKDDTVDERRQEAESAARTEDVALGLKLSDEERQYIVELAEAVGISPRRSLRFANLYKLLKASLTASERRRFVSAGGKSGDYTTAIALLAAATGAPDTTRNLLARLDANDLLDGNDPENPKIDEQVILAEVFGALGPDHDERRAFTVAHKALQRPEGGSELTFWAKRVQRFSFEGWGEWKPPPIA